MGNAKAALAIGQMYMYDYSSRAPKDKRYKYMLSMYEQAMEMDCPEGYQFMAECQSKGWGMRANTKKAMDLLKTAVEMGSPTAMAEYGAYLIEDLNQMAEGRRWLQRSLALGNGDAGLALVTSYISEENADSIIGYLRSGARLGSKTCLMDLALVYNVGLYGQAKDKFQAACYKKVYDCMNDFDAPKPIPNFDEICPLKLPILPFK